MLTIPIISFWVHFPDFEKYRSMIIELFKNSGSMNPEFHLSLSLNNNIHYFVTAQYFYKFLNEDEVVSYPAIMSIVVLK